MLARRWREILLRQLGAQVLPDDVAAERQGQAGLLEPPFAHVRHEVEPALREGELAFVDEEAHVHVAVHHGVLDRVERSEDRVKSGS